MRAFYLKHILYPCFMFCVRHVPLFLDYTIEYVRQLNRKVQGALMREDFFERAREALEKIDV